MKNNLMIFSVLIVSLMISVIAVGAGSEYNKILILENKNPTTWQIIGDSRDATLYYNDIGQEFEYKLVAYGLALNTEYSLIYYIDTGPTPEIGNKPWNLKNSVLIGTGYSNEFGYLSFSGNKDTGPLPSPEDYNGNPKEGDSYCDNENGYDDYDTCSGAKIWLITGGLDNSNWNPQAWLFETDLIQYYFGECTPEDIQVCGTGNCEGTQTCLLNGTWSPCSTAGVSCGKCESFGCGSRLGLTPATKFFNLLNGDVTCNDEGQCIENCNYDGGICADEDLNDKYPWASCHAACDQDKDCDSYCEGDIRHYGGTCDLLGCSCFASNSENCNGYDGWYDTGGETQWVDNGACTEKEQKEQEERDYYCTPNECVYSTTDRTQWIDTGEIRNKDDGTTCDDGLWCTVSDECTSGVCGGEPRDCSDNVGCTDDTCNEGSNICEHNPLDNLCDDSLFCNGTETCDILLDCQVGTPPVLDDLVDCTDDSCDEVNDVVVNAPNDAHCDDGLWCNGFETCDVINDCQAGTDVDCSDSDLIEIATCTNNDPDANPFTWDFAPSFTSTCDENNDMCTKGNYDFTHTCNINDCGAECETNIDCVAHIVQDTCLYNSENCTTECGCLYENEFCPEPGTVEEGMCYWGTKDCTDNDGCTLNVDELEIGEECDPILGPVVIIELNEGWNLISIPIVPEDTEIEVVLGDAEVSVVYAYNPLDPDADNGWLEFDNDNQQGSLTDMTAGFGYWVYAESETEIRVKGKLLGEGPVTPPSRTLVGGWNLIGHYGTLAKPVYCSLYSLIDTTIGYPRWSALFGYDSLSDEFTSLDVGSDTNSEEGYWIEMDIEDLYGPATTCWGFP